MKHFLQLITRLALLAFVNVSAIAVESAPESAARAARADRATERRLAYAASPQYNPYQTESHDCVKAANEFLAKDDYKAAISQAQKGHAVDQFDIELLMILASAYRATGDIAHADQTREEWISLVDSIMRSGDGHDFKTAYKVISVTEEYVAVRLMKLRVVSQTLRFHEGSQFDVMVVKAPDSDGELTLYFNVDLPKKWLDRQIANTAK